MFLRNKDATITTNESASEMKSTTKSFNKRSACTASSIFNSDLQIKGTLHSEGDIQIDGRVKGNIRSGSITIGEKALVDGNGSANEPALGVDPITAGRCPAFAEFVGQTTLLRQ